MTSLSNDNQADIIKAFNSTTIIFILAILILKERSTKGPGLIRCILASDALKKSTIPCFVWLVLTPLRQYAIITRGDQKKVRGKVLLNHIVLSIAMKIYKYKL